MKEEIRVGTSGWSYKAWKGKFYPKSLEQKDWLKFYTNHFDTVEVNNSFYQLPSKQTLEKWKEIVPPDFVFSLKASRYITHLKKLKEPEDSLNNFLERIDFLGKKNRADTFSAPS